MTKTRQPAAKTARAKSQKPKKTGPDPMDIHVGVRLRLRRMILGISQEKLGNSLGLTFQQVQKYEKGVNRIGASRLAELAALLSVPVQYFFDDFGETKGIVFGMAEGDQGDAFMELVNSAEGVQLCRYYSSIEDPKVKKRVLDLVKTIAETEAKSQK